MSKLEWVECAFCRHKNLNSICSACTVDRFGNPTHFMEESKAVEKPEEEVAKENDVVNHPNHYCRDGAMESIDEMELIFGVDAVMNFCLLNAWKYRYRSADKNGAEDIAKSDWYIRKYKELKDKFGRTKAKMLLNTTYGIPNEKGDILNGDKHC